MKKVAVFSARDLRNRAGGMLKCAEHGQLSVITKHGRPAAIAVPFSANLLELGVNRSLAVRLFEDQLLTLSQAAKMAGVPVAEFLDLLQKADVDAVNHPEEELKEDLDVLR